MEDGRDVYHSKHHLQFAKSRTGRNPNGINWLTRRVDMCLRLQQVFLLFTLV